MWNIYIYDTWYPQVSQSKIEDEKKIEPCLNGIHQGFSNLLEITRKILRSKTPSFISSCCIWNFRFSKCWFPPVFPVAFFLSCHTFWQIGLLGFFTKKMGTSWYDGFQLTSLQTSTKVNLGITTEDGSGNIYIFGLMDVKFGLFWGLKFEVPHK